MLLEPGSRMQVGNCGTGQDRTGGGFNGNEEHFFVAQQKSLLCWIQRIFCFLKYFSKLYICWS